MEHGKANHGIYRKTERIIRLAGITRMIILSQFFEFKETMARQKNNPAIHPATAGKKEGRIRIRPSSSASNANLFSADTSFA